MYIKLNRSYYNPQEARKNSYCPQSLPEVVDGHRSYSWCSLSQSTLATIVRLSEETGTALLKPKRKCGRNPKTSTLDVKMVHKLSVANPNKSSSYSKSDMMTNGVHLSNSLIKRRHIKDGGVARRPKTKHLLTKK